MGNQTCLKPPTSHVIVLSGCMTFPFAIKHTDQGMSTRRNPSWFHPEVLALCTPNKRNQRYGMTGKKNMTKNMQSAKFTLNSKRFPRLKSTFPLWLNLQSSPRYIQNGFQPSSHFFSTQAIRTSPLPPFGLNFFELSLSSLQQRSGLQRLGDAEKTFQGLKSFFLFPRCLFYKGLDSPQIRPQRREAAAAAPRYPATPQALAILESSRATWERWIRTIDQNFRVP